tara:strand:- start:405 stop:686 length:282 start_codon:yes stop_codon:yes gene_type:complete
VSSQAHLLIMLNKTKDIFTTMPDSVLPSLKLQAQITKRDYKKLAEALNASPTVIADLELSLEKAKSPSNPDSIIMKELTRQWSKHIKWKKKGG